MNAHEQDNQTALPTSELTFLTNQAENKSEGLNCWFPWSDPSQVVDYLQEFQTMVEELHTVEEELRQQNEALVAAQEAVEAERQRYRDLFEFAPDAYLVTDCYGIVQEANQVATQLLQIEPQHLVGKPLVNFVPPCQQRAFRARLNQLLSVDRLQEWELQLCNRDNWTFDAGLTVETVRNRHGQVVSLRWLLRDVSARKQAEEQLQQAQLQNLQLLEADRLKNYFIATISHELRTPMHAILGFSELLLRRFHHREDDQLAAIVERIFRNGKHLLLLIEELLDFSRIRSHCLELRPDTFDLVELAHATMEDLRPLAAQKQLTLEVRVVSSRLPVFNDRLRVRQIILNLLSNAIKFTEVGRITLELLSPNPDQVTIVVQDTGIGISPGDQELIFREFWQANQTTTRPYSGTGLGLAIVYSLVQLMGGGISLESQLEQGTTFRVELPARVGVPVSTIT